MKKLFLVVSGLLMTGVLFLFSRCTHHEEVTCLYGGPEMDWNDSVYVNDTEEALPDVDNSNTEQE